MKVTLAKKEQIAKNIWSFYFKPEQKIRYNAGQYIELSMPHISHDQRGKNRWFTLSSSPTEELLAITTKLSLSKGSTFKQSLFGAKIGSEFNMVSPMGDFVLPKDSSIPLVFVALGIGITPFRSIIKYLKDIDEKRQILLIYKESGEEKIVFADLLKARAELIKVINKQLEPDKIVQMAKSLKDPIYFISGPEKAVENLQNDLINLGVKPENTRADFFHNYDN